LFCQGKAVRGVAGKAARAVAGPVRPRVDGWLAGRFSGSGFAAQGTLYLVFRGATSHYR